MKKTRDYRIFKDISGNRKINKGHVNSLVQAIERKNLLEYFPVLCNEHMEVIDGQHRLSAAIQLGIEVPYAVVNGLRLEDVMEINTNSAGWKITDFIDSHIVTGKQDYVILKSFMERYGFNPTTAGSILVGFYNMRHGGSIGALIKSGEFKVASISYAEKIAGQLQKLGFYSDDNLNPMKDRELIMALMRLNANPDFSFDRLYSKMELHAGCRLEKRPSEKYYIIHIEELYNFKTSKSMVELYKSSYEHTLK